ncbi:helix-turn-helix domain-containing protein [Kribbella sp. NPDC026611]|uniref:helix-turn-helix domain-containing protein n=1 Tax=Kribbella sp. NPDC026611 TaxID=3154911 RepID=UPI0033F92366
MPNQPTKPSQHPLVEAIAPLVDRLHAELVEPADARPDDVPLTWEGEAVVAVRLPKSAENAPAAPGTANPAGTDRAETSPGDAPSSATSPGAPGTSGTAGTPGAGVQGLLAAVAEELGGPLNELSRTGKQQAVLLLEQRGAFEYRKSAEIVAEALGVTRFTVYNYLNRTR